MNLTKALLFLIASSGVAVPALARAIRGGAREARHHAPYEVNEHQVMAAPPGRRIIDNFPDFAPREEAQIEGVQVSNAEQSSTTSALVAPLSETFLLHSYPRADQTLYIDFDGHNPGGYSIQSRWQ